MPDAMAAISASTEPRAALVPVGVVLNSTAGALLDRADASTSLVELFERAGFDPTFIPTDQGTLPQRIRAAVDLGHGTVVVGGGDGTIACAAQALAGTGVTLGIMPFGTMNLLATDLGIEPAKPEVALAIIAQRHVREIDVGEVNGRVFLCASMLGLPARLAKHREQNRKGPALRLWRRFGLAAFRALIHPLPLRLVLGMDGKAHRLRTPSITVTVNALDDRTGRRFGRGQLDGGRLVVLVIRHLGLVDILRIAARLIGGHWRDDQAIDVSETQAVRIDARDALRVMNDGEVAIMQPPLNYTLRPKALKVFAPAPATAP